MQITRNTTVEEFLTKTKWELETPAEKPALAAALKYFAEHVPESVLNAPDNSSPWTPPGTTRTRLISWLQGIRLALGVNPQRRLNMNERVVQWRLRSDPPTARGDWFTWLSSSNSKLGIPAKQTAVRIFEVTAPITCMESTASDAFCGWVADGDAYRAGGAKQLFIYRDSAAARTLKLVGGAT
ncbi:hypothetical protein BH11PLA1_BH11PLA1_00140 [soil metagenome]